MANNNLIIIGTIIIALLAGGAVFFFGTVQNPTAPGKLDAFAQCIANSGATFYGAFWCPHCQNQKKMFGSSAKLLPYVECSTPDGNGQLQVCIDKGVKSYPTWEFPDGSTTTGEVALQDLAAKTNCQLPDSSAAPADVNVDAGAASAAEGNQ